MEVKDFWYFWSQKYGTRNTGFPPTREGQKLRNAGLLTPLMCRTNFVGCSHSGVGLPLVAHRTSQGLNNMGKLEPLNLAIRARNPEYYDKSRDMETALVYNAIKKILESEGREELFSYIKSVKLTDKNIVVRTGKPVVNAELKMYREKIAKEASSCLKTIGNNRTYVIRII